MKATITIIMAVLSLALAGAARAQSKEELDQRLARVERLLDSQGLVELFNQVEMLRSQVQRLQGQIETQTYTLDQLKDRQQELYATLENRLQALENAGPNVGSLGAGGEPPLGELSAADAAPVAGTPTDNSLSVEITDAPRLGAAQPSNVAPQIGGIQNAPAPVAATTAPIDAAPGGAGLAAVAPPVTSVVPGQPREIVDTPESEAAYQGAFDLLKAGRYESAVVALKDYLAQYPNSQYVDNAQYWVGEAYYVMRQFEPAIAEYQRLIQAYPDSQKRSHAMLKIGYSYYELGRMDLARATLEELKANFPGTTAARLADERIQRIRLESAS